MGFQLLGGELSRPSFEETQEDSWDAQH